MRIAIASCLLSLCLTVSAAARSPEETLQDFYSWVLSKRESALSVSAKQKRLMGVLSPRLAQLIVEAAEAERRCIQAVKGTTDKPYFFEVDVFIGNWGGADEVAYADVEPVGDEVTAAVTYFSVNREFAKGRRSRVEMWVVKVKMLADRSVWRIDDLQYENGETLTSRFSAYLSNSREICHP